MVLRGPRGRRAGTEDLVRCDLKICHLWLNSDLANLTMSRLWRQYRSDTFFSAGGEHTAMQEAYGTPTCAPTRGLGVSQHD